MGDLVKHTLWGRRALVWGSLVFALFGILVATGWSKPFDLPIDHWVLHHLKQRAGTPDWGGIGYLSIWGSQYATIPVTIVTVMGLLAMGARRKAVIVSTVGFVGGLLILGFQVAFRSFVAAHWGDTGAQVVYPSGHSAGASMAWGFAGFFLLMAYSGERPRWVRPLLIVTWAAINLGVGVDRVLVRSHIVSDILGGWGLGIALVGLAQIIDREAPHPRERA
jgi:membrane-associated phospholipid phosphatase